MTVRRNVVPDGASRAPRTSRGALVVVAIFGVLSAAPTPGDVGGCGSEVRLLDRDAYARARKTQDCRRCGECAIQSDRCTRACDAASPPETVVPASCRPLFHDGEVCLRARADASCATFARYVDDSSPTSPSECEFCKATSSAALEKSEVEPSSTAVEPAAVESGANEPAAVESDASEPAAVDAEDLGSASEGRP